MLPPAQLGKLVGMAEYRVRCLVKENDGNFVVIMAGVKALINVESFISFLNSGKQNSAPKKSIVGLRDLS